MTQNEFLIAMGLIVVVATIFNAGDLFPDRTLTKKNYAALLVALTAALLAISLPPYIW